jgi:hypothetical protein
MNPAVKSWLDNVIIPVLVKMYLADCAGPNTSSCLAFPPHTGLSSMGLEEKQ